MAVGLEAADRGDGGHEPVERPAAPDKGRGSGHRLGRNIAVAVGIGVVAGAILLAILYYAKPVFPLLIIGVGCLGVWELTRAFGLRQIAVPLPPLLAIVVAAIASGYLAGFTGLAVSTAFGVLCMLAWRLRGGVAGYVRDATAGVAIACYVPLLLGFAALLLTPADGADRVVIWIAAVFASDTGGLLLGAAIGRHQMSPVISPKKSWEGGAGSVILSGALTAVLVWWLLDGAWWYGAVVGVTAAVVGTAGDLVESVIKRDIGIKDMSSLVPGHGGMMDRLDSLLAAAPAVWVLLTLLVPPGP
ncbi:MAG: phosphatidate cytidylyltransferase [Streptosporangiales bacterium]